MVSDDRFVPLLFVMFGEGGGVETVKRKLTNKN